MKKGLAALLAVGGIVVGVAIGDENGNPPGGGETPCYKLNPINICVLLGINTNGFSGCKDANGNYDPNTIFGISNATVKRAVQVASGESGRQGPNVDNSSPLTYCTYRKANGIDQDTGACLWTGATWTRGPAQDHVLNGGNCTGGSGGGGEV